jgi:hypothetical protein
MALSRLRLRLFININDDYATAATAVPSARPPLTRRQHLQPFLIFASQGHIARLVIETLVMRDYAPLADVPHSVRKAVTFKNMRALRTCTTVAMAPRMMSWTPKAPELALDVIDATPTPESCAPLRRCRRASASC